MNQQTQPEEIDIIQFFTAIGNMFKNFFKGIGNIFKWFFYTFIDIIIYLKKHYIILGLGFLLGLGLSFLGNKKKETYYGQATLRTNYNAQLDLQEKVAALNGLIQKHDSIGLGKMLDLPSEDAAHFTNFELNPVINDVFLIDDYEEYLKTKDTVVYKFIEYEDYKKNIHKNNNLNRYWSLKISADSPLVFNKLNIKIKALFNKDTAIEKRKQNFLSYLDIKKQKLLRSLSDIDSMRSIYNRVWLESAQKPGVASTNIVVANQKITGPEATYNLFYERHKALNNLKKTVQQINKYDDAVIILNSFPNNGIQEISILDNKHTKYALLGFLLALFILLLKDFNVYLNKYQQLKAGKS